jgi:hypothetical protein
MRPLRASFVALPKFLHRISGNGPTRNFDVDRFQRPASGWARALAAAHIGRLGHRSGVGAGSPEALTTDRDHGLTGVPAIRPPVEYMKNGIECR